MWIWKWKSGKAVICWIPPCAQVLKFLVVLTLSYTQLHKLWKSPKGLFHSEFHTADNEKERR